jgi:phosphoenolpyruvate phosphomutase
MSPNNPAAARLRARLDPARPAVAMAAHNALVAKLAAEAGFDAIWGGSFELAASYAVPDANILSVDIHLELMRAIAEVQPLPVVADLDTGYGNAVNVAYLVPRYAAAGAAAVVIEDKTFPKDSSLRPGGRQVLVPVGEFQGKIEAARVSGAAGDRADRSADRWLGPGRGIAAGRRLCRGRCRRGADP